MINLTYPSSLSSEYQGIKFVDVREKLPVNPLYTWTQLKGIRPITDLTTIVFHHDGMPKHKYAKYTDMELMAAIANAHINSKKNRSTGDPGFPYDVYVRSGIIYFTNYIETLEYGVASNNRYTVNLCVAGDYANFDTLTDVDRKALYAAYFMLRAVLPSYKASLGHGEITPTQCPGFDMNRIRDDIHALEASLAVSAQWNDRIAEVNRFNRQLQYLGGLIAKGEGDGSAKWALKGYEDIIGYAKKIGYYK
jgi:hypothetical protein